MFEILLAAALYQTDNAAPVSSDPPGSCISVALGGGFENAALRKIDGATIEKPSDLKKLSKSAAKSGAAVIVNGGIFSGWQMKKLKLQNICFIGSDFSESDWSRVEASGLGFIGSNISKANFAGAQIPSTLLRENDLSDFNASGANLDNGLLDGGWKGSLARAKFDGAFMRGFRFNCGTGEADGCPFDRQNMSFKGADLTLSAINSFAFWDVEFTDAQIGGVRISPSQLEFFNGVRMDRPVILVNGNAEAPVTQEQFAAIRSGISYRAGPDTAPWCTDSMNEQTCPVVGRDVAALHQDIARLSAEAKGRAADRAKLTFEGARTACLTKGGGEQSDCLLSLHWTRREQLIAQRKAPGFLDGSTLQLYAASELNIDPAFSQSELFKTIAPVVMANITEMALLKSEKANQAHIRMRKGPACRLDFNNMIYLPRTGKMARSNGRRVYRALFSVSDQLLAWGAPESSRPSNSAPDCEGQSMLLRRINVPQNIVQNLWNSLSNDAASN